MPTATLKQINKVLGRNFITKYGTKQGIGAANSTLAVRATRRAFGPAPESWSEEEPARP